MKMTPLLWRHVCTERSQLVQYLAHSFTTCQVLNTIASYDFPRESEWGNAVPYSGTKPICRIFHILKINRIMPFCNLFIGRPSYRPTVSFIQKSLWQTTCAQILVTYRLALVQFSRSALVESVKYVGVNTALWS